MYVTGHSKAFATLLSEREVYNSGMAWLSIVMHEETLWSNFREVKRFDPNAEFDFPYTVFSLRGNKYRIITEIQYKSSSVDIISVFSFSEYKKYGASSLVNSKNKVEIKK